MNGAIPQLICVHMGLAPECVNLQRAWSLKCYLLLIYGLFAQALRSLVPISESSGHQSVFFLKKMAQIVKHSFLFALAIYLIIASASVIRSYLATRSFVPHLRAPTKWPTQTHLSNLLTRANIWFLEMMWCMY